jgi:hypothetical protein
MDSNNSTSALISELTEHRRRLWLLIAVCKQIAHALPPAERAQLLGEAMAAEKHLTGGIHA